MQRAVSASGWFKERIKDGENERVYAVIEG